MNPPEGFTPDEAPAGPTFSITVLRAVGQRRLVKTYTPTGKRGTDEAGRFLVERHEVHSPREFFAFLSGLESRRDRCLVRAATGRWFPDDGEPVYRLLHPQTAYADAAGRRVTEEKVRAYGREPEVGETLFHATALPMFVEQPTPWIAVDFDKVSGEPDWRSDLPGTAKWLRDRMTDFQLPTSSAATVEPSTMSVRRDMPRHMTVLPGGGSLPRAR